MAQRRPESITTERIDLLAEYQITMTGEQLALLLITLAAVEQNHIDRSMWYAAVPDAVASQVESADIARALLRVLSDALILSSDVGSAHSVGNDPLPSPTRKGGELWQSTEPLGEEGEQAFRAWVARRALQELA